MLDTPEKKLIKGLKISVWDMQDRLINLLSVKQDKSSRGRRTMDVCGGNREEQAAERKGDDDQGTGASAPV